MRAGSALVEFRALPFETILSLKLGIMHQYGYHEDTFQLRANGVLLNEAHHLYQYELASVPIQRRIVEIRRLKEHIPRDPLTPFERALRDSVVGMRQQMIADAFRKSAKVAHGEGAEAKRSTAAAATTAAASVEAETILRQAVNQGWAPPERALQLLEQNMQLTADIGAYVTDSIKCRALLDQQRVDLERSTHLQQSLTGTVKSLREQLAVLQSERKGAISAAVHESMTGTLNMLDEFPDVTKISQQYLALMNAERMDLIEAIESLAPEDGYDAEAFVFGLIEQAGAFARHLWQTAQLRMQHAVTSLVAASPTEPLQAGAALTSALASFLRKHDRLIVPQGPLWRMALQTMKSDAIATTYEVRSRRVQKLLQSGKVDARLEAMVTNLVEKLQRLAWQMQLSVPPLEFGPSRQGLPYAPKLATADPSCAALVTDAKKAGHTLRVALCCYPPLMKRLPDIEMDRRQEADVLGCVVVEMAPVVSIAIAPSAAAAGSGKIEAGSVATVPVAAAPGKTTGTNTVLE